MNIYIRHYERLSRGKELLEENAWRGGAISDGGDIQEQVRQTSVRNG